MFETSQTEQKSSGAGMWIVLSIVIVLAIVGTMAYMNRDTSTKSTTQMAASAATANQAGADAVKDLRIVSAKMDKDFTGTTAMWSVDIKNQSSTFTYTNVGYETTYVGGDNSVLLQNHGKVPVTLAPGEEETTQIRDALFPTGTALYRFRVTDADSTK
jgi:hypothetical protein